MSREQRQKAEYREYDDRIWSDMDARPSPNAHLDPTNTQFYDHSLARKIPRKEPTMITAELMTDRDRRKAEYPCLSFASPECEEHFNAVCRFAAIVGALENFERRVRYLATYAQPHRVTECVLCSDFAPYSFGFLVKEFVPKDFTGTERWEPFLRGGLIYSGPGQPLDGSGPAFTVSLSPSKNIHDWSVHT